MLMAKASSPLGTVPVTLPKFYNFFEGDSESVHINGCTLAGVLASDYTSRNDANNSVSKYWLIEKYKGMHFVDKNPGGEAGDAPAEDEDVWEHRVITGVDH